MRKATLKSRDFTLLIQLFGEFNDRSVDVGVSKYTSKTQKSNTKLFKPSVSDHLFIHLKLLKPE